MSTLESAPGATAVTFCSLRVLLFATCRRRSEEASPLASRAAFADVLARIADHNIQKLDQLLPWNWKAARQQQAAA
jgi:hypothetical protein